MGGKRTPAPLNSWRLWTLQIGSLERLPTRADSWPQPVFGYIPLRYAAGSLLDGEPAQVGAAYAAALAIAVERQDIVSGRAAGPRNDVAECDPAWREIPSGRHARLDQITCGLLRPYRPSPGRNRNQERGRQEQCCFRFHSEGPFVGCYGFCLATFRSCSSQSMD